MHIIWYYLHSILLPSWSNVGLRGLRFYFCVFFNAATIPTSSRIKMTWFNKIREYYHDYIWNDTQNFLIAMVSTIFYSVSLLKIDHAVHFPNERAERVSTDTDLYS